jgi:hypothetical protein
MDRSQKPIWLEVLMEFTTKTGEEIRPKFRIKMDIKHLIKIEIKIKLTRPTQGWKHCRITLFKIMRTLKTFSQLG